MGSVLFAETDWGATVVIAAITGIICSVTTAIIRLRKSKSVSSRDEAQTDQIRAATEEARRRASQKKRKDAIAEWKGIVAQYQEDMMYLRHEMDGLRNEHSRCTDKLARAETWIEAMEKDLEDAGVTLSRPWKKDGTNTHTPLSPEKEGG